MTLALDAFGARVELLLRRNDDLFHERYRASTLHANGTATVTSAHPGTDHCHYHGEVTNEDAAPGGKSVVAFSTCDGLRGKVFTRAHTLTIEPAHLHVEGHDVADALDPRMDRLRTKVVVFREEDRKSPLVIDGGGAEAPLPPMRFVDTDGDAVGDGDGDFTPWDWDPARDVAEVAAVPVPGYAKDMMRRFGRARGRRRLSAETGTVTLELLVVNDLERYQEYTGAGAKETMEADSVTVVNLVAALWKDISTPQFIVSLVGQYSNIGSNAHMTSTDATTLLTNFNTWRGTKIGTLTKHDTAHLFSGVDFMHEGSSGVIGLAWQRGVSENPKRYASSVCELRDYCPYVATGYCYSPNGDGNFQCCYDYVAGAISEVSINDNTDASVTVAHEIGHQVGFMHDGSSADGTGSCASGGSIMGAYLSSGIDAWSACSKSTYDTNIGCLASSAVEDFACLARSGDVTTCPPEDEEEWEFYLLYAVVAAVFVAGVVVFIAWWMGRCCGRGATRRREGDRDDDDRVASAAGADDADVQLRVPGDARARGRAHACARGRVSGAGPVLGARQGQVFDVDDLDDASGYPVVPGPGPAPALPAPAHGYAVEPPAAADPVSPSAPPKSSAQRR